ncbi:MAG: DUF1844 domain-containing protein [Candidatus Omnitrophota bacterium]|jgi:hypothetical protein
MAQENNDSLKKKVDESWKEAMEKERSSSDKQPVESLEVTFHLFVSSLMMEALVALGDIEHPVTKKKELNPTHAKFVIDTLSMLQEKTSNNLSKDESNMLESMLYDLRMRFVNKAKK